MMNSRMMNRRMMNRRMMVSPYQYTGALSYVTVGMNPHPSYYDSAFGGDTHYNYNPIEIEHYKQFTEGPIFIYDLL